MVRIYILLIRSLIEYSSILFSCLNNQHKNKLQIIQNNCLRIILNKPKHFSIIELHKLGNITKLDERFTKLNSKFIMKSLVTNNPLLTDLALEYLNYRGGRIISRETPLCFIHEKIKIYFDSLKPP